MPIVRFEREQLTSTAWKNGGGRTREIVRMPAGSSMDTFDWRASIADITADGPFSAFVGFDRMIVLLSGDGVYLRSNDGTIDHRLDEPLAPFAFDGESAIEASLIGGASSDFNMMTRQATMHGDVRVVVGHETLAASSAGLLLAAHGTWDVRTVRGGPPSCSLASNCGLWWDGESLGWKVAPHTADGALITVRVRPKG